MSDKNEKPREKPINESYRSEEERYQKKLKEIEKASEIARKKTKEE